MGIERPAHIVPGQDNCVSWKGTGSFNARYHFGSLGELIDWCERNKRPEGRSTKESRYDNWEGSKTWEEMLDLARHGWINGLEAVDANVTEIKRQSGTVQDFSYQFSDEGSFFDVGEVLSGTPDHWLSPVPEPPRRVISINISSTYSGGMSHDSIMLRGAAICALIDKLQQDPTNVVELVASDPRGKKGDVKIGFYLTLSLGVTPLDMDTVAFVLGHPSFLRRLLFCFTEVICEKDDCIGYGTVNDAPDKDNYSMYIGGMLYGRDKRLVVDAASAAKWVEDNYNKLTGVEPGAQE